MAEVPKPPDDSDSSEGLTRSLSRRAAASRKRLAEEVPSSAVPSATPSSTRTPESGGTPGSRSANSYADGFPSGLIEPGQVLFDKYRVEKKLGEGGMGEVWLVRHLELDCERALKLILKGIADDAQARQRFRREAKAMARFSHPNAVVVHDARQYRNVAFIEMECVSGRSLKQLLVPGAAMPLDWVARVAGQLCDVLHLAHERGIVHRDLKPSNLMLLDGRSPGEEHLKVLDFGIAKIRGSENRDLEGGTITKGFVGTYYYASPEQCNEFEVDQRSDLYSVGVILYELLTGHRPFGGSAIRTMYDHVSTPPPPFAERNPHAAVPVEVEEVVRRCLAKSPNDRPQSARALAQEIKLAFASTMTNRPRTAPNAVAQELLEDLNTVAQVGTTEHDDPLVDTEDEEFCSEDSVADPALLDTEPGTSEAPGAEDRRLPHAGRRRLLQVCVLFATAGAMTIWLSPSLRSRLLGNVGSPSVIASLSRGLNRATTGRSPLVNPSIMRPMPPGYQGDPRRILAGGWPEVIVHERDGTGTRFRRFADGVYLPEGYKSETPTEYVEGWPRVITRERDGTRFIRIPGGEFRMGGLEKAPVPNPLFEDSDDKSKPWKPSDQPAHDVVLSGYYLQATEVTRGEMDNFFRLSRREPSGGLAKHLASLSPRLRKHPATNVSRHLAEEYAFSVGGRLPTEAQWEYAMRSLGQPRLYLRGDHVPGDDEANCGYAMSNAQRQKEEESIPTSPVGSIERDRTDQGIYDMTGNVREWCRDAWAPYSDRSQRNPCIASLDNDPETLFVIRGSSFSSGFEQGSTTRRDDRDVAKQEAGDLGFRVVIETPLATDFPPLR